jgi:hypothetical protein
MTARLLSDVIHNAGDGSPINCIDVVDGYLRIADAAGEILGVVIVSIVGLDEGVGSLQLPPPTPAFCNEDRLVPSCILVQRGDIQLAVVGTVGIA